MNAILKRMSSLVVLALSTGVCAGVLGHRAFNRLVRSDVLALLARTGAREETLITETMLQALPEPVQRYLRHTGIVGKPIVRTVHLRQKGRMRTGPGRPWIPLDAEEHYSVQPPGFVWDGTMHLGLLPVGRARDMYLDGRGHMLVKAASLLSVVDARGEEMDQGSMMRYLSEMIFFPSAFLAANVSFEAIDDSSARVTLTDHGRSATGTMYVDEAGRLTDFVAQRYRMVDGRCDPETWSTPVTEYGEFEGLKLPIRGKAVWKLADGDLEYIDVTITELQYDVRTH
ncbi:DUF6544 family protein [Streptomyces flaveus]|uniref:Uncharacterized protein n=1 Tax=Streptomyces flaveus TaxID=66370 RepID=A0A917RNM4_9ACTN|nr:DUF6544 family protein [Streptomyces flaveus]GGL16594.1 hypothetical protein GCM10010094_91790 [Streptomyces flaveus]